VGCSAIPTPKFLQCHRFLIVRKRLIHSTVLHFVELGEEQRRHHIFIIFLFVVQSQDFRDAIWRRESSPYSLFSLLLPVALYHRSNDNRAAVPCCAIQSPQLGYVLVVLNPFDRRSINPFALNWTCLRFYRNIASCNSDIAGCQYERHRFRCRFNLGSEYTVTMMMATRTVRFRRVLACFAIGCERTIQTFF
jgi:hypothetical protein